ncbi:type 1 glutamine amidotransferase [Parvibaculum sp.]|jgi:GMP synthase (glutamine-hydrolysing)|uniref:type 1 glutamine amidotransferase n=1 Tax=Parvibaculum sp. TaxID=2024848 RepID=UPI001B048A75|nr:type 1 glutamine amidotransferase [Parvibaculum sp.]MBO6633334.1 type 1 glutamine amidotransferase [Parvibaculum sp.]MBO6678172.1 type 1 glutamine amidotransferase [Parvibaculum sp.]MBO6683681.1 type 1 glutamine amidotransferase [Parvibaculum sp.]
MHILYLVNALDSGPGVLLDEAARAGAKATLIHTTDMRDMTSGAVRDVPDGVEDFDGLVVLGGAMGVYDEARHPFIDKTRKLIRRFHEAEKPIMGVCLGSQLVASAFGSPVYRMKEKLSEEEEWGFLPQTWKAAAAADALLADAEPGLRIMQWHGDTFDMPESAVPLSTREGCPSQAFRLGEKTYAFQFHLEVTREILDGWSVYRANALKRSKAEIDALIQPQIEASLDAQETFARRTMRRWMALA